MPPTHLFILFKYLFGCVSGHALPFIGLICLTGPAGILSTLTSPFIGLICLTGPAGILSTFVSPFIGLICLTGPPGILSTLALTKFVTFDANCVFNLSFFVFILNSLSVIIFKNISIVISFFAYFRPPSLFPPHIYPVFSIFLPSISCIIIFFLTGTLSFSQTQSTISPSKYAYSGVYVNVPSELSLTSFNK